MFGATGLTLDAPAHAELSFRDLSGWTSFLDGAFASNFVTIGDTLTGPVLALTASGPGEMPPAPAHSHASDTLRICLSGEYGVGRATYAAGDFRLQRGWRPYVDERWGSDGAWVLILIADRRGLRARLVDEELAASDFDRAVRQMSKDLTTSHGIVVDDWLSDDPADSAGASALATTLGRTAASGKLEGTFTEAHDWLVIGDDVRAAIALLGEPDSGPVAVMSSAGAGAVASARCRYDTEVARVTIRGSSTIGDRRYAAGDFRLQRAGTWCDKVVAGPDGVDELVVVADRRRAQPHLDPQSLADWPAGLPDLVSILDAEVRT